MNDGSRTARPTIAPMLSSAAWTGRGAGPRISGSTTSTARITAAKTRNTELQGMTSSSASASRRPDHLAGGAGGGGDAEGQRPALGRGGAADDREDHAEAGAGDAEADQHVEQLVRRPAVTAKAESASPTRVEQRAERRSPGGRRTARRSAPKIGWPMPQARFWMAIASEKSARGQPNCSAIGIWNSPKLARMPKPTSRIGAARDQHGRDQRGLGVGHGRARSGIGKRDAATPAKHRSNAIRWRRPSPGVMAAPTAIRSRRGSRRSSGRPPGRW